MTSLYKQSVPVFIKYLRNLSGLLEKGAKYCDETGMKHEEMLTFRLRDDMRGLPFQVQSCSNTAKFLAVRVGGLPNVVLEDNETTFEELQARIKRTISILEELPATCMDGKEDAEIIMKTLRMGDYRFTGHGYVCEYAVPNFHFHLTTAYCILRHLGVPLSAIDYLNDVFEKAQ